MSTKTVSQLREELKANEDRINGHLEALKEEVTGSSTAVKDLIKQNPWLGVGGALAIGVVTGLLLGKRSKKEKELSLVDEYLDKLANMAREAGASQEHVGLLLRDALRETMPPVSVEKAAKKSKGVAGLLFGLASDVAMGFARNSLLSYIQGTMVGTQNPAHPDENHDS